MLTTDNTLRFCSRCGQKFEPQPGFKNVCRSCRTTLSQKNGLMAFKVSTLELNENMRQVVLGSLLGDGCFENQNKHFLGNYLVSIKHGLKQTEYTLWKKNLLNELCPNKVQYPKERIRIRTIVHPEITKIAKQIIIDGRKSPSYLAFKDLNQLGFAVWYMDDGNLSFDHGTTPNIRFATCAFTLQEINELRTIIEEKVNVKTVLCKWKNPRNPNAPYLGIKLNKNETIKFIEWILKSVNVPASMMYKFNYVR